MTARVLVVDDDAAMRRVLVKMLTRGGFEVHAVDDGGSAIALSSDLEFDIVVADLNMRFVGGIDVVRHYKGLGRQVFCVVLTGDDNEESAQSCFRAGADDLIIKPISPIALRTRLIAAGHGTPS